MSGELQTIPARHGVATFVPRGRTIKIINTYGKQVVSTWAFGLHAPPDGTDSVDEQELEDDIEEKVKELKEEVEKGNEAEQNKKVGEVAAATAAQESSSASKETEHVKATEQTEEPGAPSKETEDTREGSEAGDPPEQAPDTPENEKTTETTEEKPESSSQPSKRTWSSYLPSIPYRSRATPQTNAAPPKPDAATEKAQNEAASKKWSSYLPTGKGFSSYVPAMQMPDSKDVVSAFKASHYRDPNKSYAEQLYDFSKTPVGAGGLAAATGSGTASSIYAAYSAYTKLSPSKSSLPPMEYLSLPHTRAATHRLVPAVNDTLLTNLRNPLLTLIEDTTPGAHDTLTAACDASLYAALHIDRPAEHGSCAENLVLALKELNEKAGLKGSKAVGADITVNIAPTPLHLFMNAPIDVSEAGDGAAAAAVQGGAGAQGAKLRVEEPRGKKRSFVRFRAERDVVVVLSACPMDVGPQNGGRCMAANFMVEEVGEEDMAGSVASVGKSRSAPKKLSSQPKKAGGEVPRAAPEAAEKQSEVRRDSGADDPPEQEIPEEGKAKVVEEKKKGEEEKPKPKKKPKKLERRGGAATPVKSESSGS